MKYNSNRWFNSLGPALLLLALFGLSACVTTYQAAEGGVAGFRDLQIDKYSYYVEYTEAATVPWDQIEQFAIKRCAEIAKERGFVVFDAELLDRKSVFLESSVDEIQIMSMGNTAADPPVHHTYKGSAKVEGRRVTFKLTLINE
ncbi:hypothetical protein A3742_32065 [Oleiphilus sp. HI0071]|uniref:CC0125/CC1285 family lipoprotein n=1 Tax=unclassified Oleiphilus TaxID=2631174 RepID=UPI0007C28276|nr:MULTISPECIES: hypothetical protein [unclassified Oleiphilus]KZY67196.1 hypothetical protein A3737_12970 [Oleiphilus sp. HI0065]KZY79796.1 hypothetical protein A3742_13900 [Oleiphilus sp. HI0071]KZY91929.1 hypothetical protein A3744_03565 [Oleiphilus sp. HI0073]KZZ48868.1 hypothetical protein A3760_22595 [Oleiphilus sp. HI0122]KZZ49879.1 hypothetical protein A3758_13585 [Oleiphilus sp. HI0118]KZZ69767.1 hypothetical protein A3765_03535 [Oleiphilus sp. HI0130]KZZ80615.1 hypothetical protein